MGRERNVEALNELLKKVVYSQKIYERAAKSVHSDVFRERLQKIAQERAAYAERIKGEIVERHGSPESGKSIDLMLKELYMMISDLQIQRNVPDMLNMCLQADQDLMDQHARLIREEHFLHESDPVAQLIYGEQDHVEELSREFSEKLEAYPWK